MALVAALAGVMGLVLACTEAEEPTGAALPQEEVDSPALDEGEREVQRERARRAVARSPGRSEFAGSPGLGAEGPRPPAEEPEPSPAAMVMRERGLGTSGTGRGGGGTGVGALPQSGVLASNFVGGHGVQARLDDLLERGVMIDGKQVRLEAFEDRGRLPYAVPGDEAVALHAELERTKVPTEGDRVHLQVALLAKQGEAPPRPRLDVRLVVDRSGSMQDRRKWNEAIRAAHALVDRLEPGDTFGLVSYAEEASLDLRPQRVGRARRSMHAAIDGMRPGGGTNIGAALELVEANAPVRRRPSDVGLVVLLSDGRASVGITDPRALGDTARAMFDEGGVLTTTIGVGTDFDETIMLTIAREGSGSYHFVRRAADIEGILQDELEDRVQAVAQALRVRVVLGEGVVARKVYGSRLLSESEHARVRATEVANDARIARELGIARDREEEEREGLRMHLPTFRRGDQHVILMELEVPGGAPGSLAGVARVHLEYKDLVRRENAETDALVTARRVESRDAVMASTERAVKRTVLAFQAGEALQLAADALGVQDASEARRRLVERRELLEAAADAWRDPGLRKDAALLARYEQVVGRAWNGFGRDEQRTLVMAMNYFGDQRMR